MEKIDRMLKINSWNKEDLIDLIYRIIPDLSYIDNGKYLDEKM